MRHKHKHRRGAGIVDVIKSVGNYLSQLPPVSAPSSKFTKILKEYGNYIVNHVTIVRVPIIGAIQRFKNFLRKVLNSDNNPNYDKLFHLYAVLDLNNGKQIKIERNEVFQMALYSGNPPAEAEEIDAGSPSEQTTFNDFMKKAVDSQGTSFWRYHPYTNNCQKAIKTILTANGMWTDKLDKFVMQDVSSLLGGEKGVVADVSSKITDIAGSLRQNILGGSKRHRHYWKRKRYHLT